MYDTLAIMTRGAITQTTAREDLVDSSIATGKTLVIDRHNVVSIKDLIMSEIESITITRLSDSGSILTVKRIGFHPISEQIDSNGLLNMIADAIVADDSLIDEIREYTNEHFTALANKLHAEIEENKKARIFHIRKGLNAEHTYCGSNALTAYDIGKMDKAVEWISDEICKMTPCHACTIERDNERDKWNRI